MITFPLAINTAAPNEMKAPFRFDGGAVFF